MTRFIESQNSEFHLNGKQHHGTQISSIDISQNSSAVLVMRLHFVVHSFINLYVTQGDQEIAGHKIIERNTANKQSHLLTIDKPVLEMQMIEAFKEESQKIRIFGKREGLMISDFDEFMPQGNPIVNFERL